MNKPDWQMRRISPQLSITVSPEAAAYIEAVLYEFPMKYRSKSSVVDTCIVACARAKR